MQTYEFELTVTQDDLDDLKHVNNVRYVQWIQDIAKQHWLEYTSLDITDNYFWILLSHHLEYKNPAFLNDIILLKTFVTKADGVTSIRMVEIYNKTTNKLLVVSETKWCLINAKTNRPTRITTEIGNLFN